MAACLSALLMAGCASSANGGSPTGAPADRQSAGAAATAAKPAPNKIPVRVVELRRDDVSEFLDLTGTAQPWELFEVSSEIPGRVVKIHADQGDWVKRGAPLLELDREKREIELQSRQANLARNQVELEFARKRLKRGRALLDKGAISESEVDTLEQAVQVSETTVRMSEIAIDSIREEIEDTRIHSPVAGQISRRGVSLGETVNPAATLFEIIQIHPLKVLTEIPEPYLHQVRPGQTARMVFEAVSPEAEMRGRIHFIHPVANPQSGSFPTEIRMENPAGRFQPGMVARVQIEAGTYRQALVAPLDAVVELQGETVVYVVVDGKARRRTVQISKRLGSQAILSGEVGEGDLLVVEGNTNVTDGAEVEVLS